MKAKIFFKLRMKYIYQLNNTKRLFIAMILTVMIILPLVFVITFELLKYDSSSSFILNLIEPSHYKSELEENFFREDTLLYTITRNVPLIIELLWLGIGIKQ